MKKTLMNKICVFRLCCPYIEMSLLEGLNQTQMRLINVLPCAWSQCQFGADFQLWWSSRLENNYFIDIQTNSSIFSNILFYLNLVKCLQLLHLLWIRSLFWMEVERFTMMFQSAHKIIKLTSSKRLSNFTLCSVCFHTHHITLQL